MTCQRFNLACGTDGTDFAIYQGTTYNQVTFFYRDVDISAYTPIGQIRTNYFDAGGILLDTFTFAPLSYGSVTDETGTYDATIIQPILSASQTALLPGTLEKQPSAAFLPGINGHVYDIKLIGASETIILVRGFVEVIQDVSRSV